MSFQLARTHTLVVLAATTIAASAVVIPSLAEGRNSSQDALCASLIGAQGPIGSQYNPLLASYAAAAGRATTFAGDHAREAQLRAALSDAQAALESAKAGPSSPPPLREARPFVVLRLIADWTGSTGPQSMMQRRRGSLRRSSFKR